MKIQNDIRAIAIGSFDGMHIAHRELIALADEVVVIERQRDYPSLTPGYKRSWYCDKPMAFYRFEIIRHLGAEAFVTRLRESYPHLEKIVVGYDFRFGKGRQGDPEILQQLFDGEVVVISEVTRDGISVHAQTIRRLLASGELERASHLLGRRYRIDGEPVRGQGLGRKEFVPTINLSVEEYQLPAEGVYAGYTLLAGEPHPSVIFLGHRESVDGSFAIETHLLGEAVERVPSRVFLEFAAFLRPNRRFGSFGELRKQIVSDIDRAREVLTL
jgi:riboflavin kinase/FMN adenylyltransferase